MIAKQPKLTYQPPKMAVIGTFENLTQGYCSGNVTDVGFNHPVPNVFSDNGTGSPGNQDICPN